jgi:DNA repair exonuclease SbcCD nuclease subunit
MPRFLHLADVHLGFDRYDSRERTKDFFLAFQDALEKYAIAPRVDFVLIAGDLFEHRNLQPHILNQAQVCLQRLREEGIPVLAIEGNHDNRPFGTRTSWLRYLADWDLVYLLEPGNPSLGEPIYESWNPHNKRGGYMDLDCGVRVLGSYWYGSSAPRAISTLAEAIQKLPAGPAHTVMMFHHGMEGQIARYQGALAYGSLLPLKHAGVDYLALGHIHKNYTVENWIYNPGSVEANSIEESQFERGVYLVEIDQMGIRAELKQDYQQRSCVRLQLKARGDETLADLEDAALETVQNAIQSGKLVPSQLPIVELRIEGQVGFNRLDLDTRALQQKLQQISNALIFLLKYNVDTVEYASPISEQASRLEVEQDVFIDLLTANNTYKKQAAELAQGLLDLKDLQLEGRSQEELYEFVENFLEAKLR